MSQSNPTSQKRLSHCFLCNCAFLVFMVAAGFVIHSGQSRYLPHSSVDKQHVKNVIASGETEAAWDALNYTETARASGFQSVVTMIDLMQIATVVIALFFILNCYFLFRLRSTPTPAHVPVMVRS